VLAPATLAALPSTRAIETRSLPTSLAATHRGFAFYVASPKSSIPWIATCSMPLASLRLYSANLTLRRVRRQKNHSGKLESADGQLEHDGGIKEPENAGDQSIVSLQ
jgi:hypothetical protein